MKKIQGVFLRTPIRYARITMNLLVLAGVWLSSAGQNLAKGGRGAEGLGWVFNAEFSA
jgi:hypothetical protein